MDTLTEDELDVLSGMFIVFLHSAERILRVMEQHYETIYRQSNDYMKLCKKVGKPRADEILRNETIRVVRGDQKNKIGKILKAAELFKSQMEGLTINAAESHVDGVTFAQSFDALHHDVEFLCRFYAKMVNCNGKNDEVMLDAFITRLAQGDRCSERIINNFKIVL